MSIASKSYRVLLLGLLLTLVFSFPARCQEQESRWVFQSKPVKADVAVVFIHGLIGETLSTWTNSQGRTFFQLLKDNPDVGPKVDVFAFGFTSKMFGGGSLDTWEAGTKLDELLDFHGVWSYQRVVIVAHSMGGLVAMSALSTRPERRAKVPLLVLYATPQEGSQIAALGEKLLGSNPALRSLMPIDSNVFLKTLDDSWRRLDASVPYVACAYETKTIFGKLVVPYGSSTRFCKGNSMPVGGADHVSIVKPMSATSDSVIFLVNRLRERVFNASQQRSLLTPDFTETEDGFVLVLKNKEDRTPAKLVNNTGAPLTYMMSKFSDRRLYYWPHDTPRSIPAKQSETLAFAAPLATADAYTFALEIVGGKEYKVVIRMPPKAPTDRKKKTLPQAVASEITAFVRSSPDNVSREQVVATARGAVKSELKNFPAEDQPIVVAEVLSSLNLSDLASVALESASANARQIEELRSFLTTQAAGTVRVDQGSLRSVYLATDDGRVFEELASTLKQVPSLRTYGFGIEGDLQYARGNSSAAKLAYEQALAGLAPTRSVQTRLDTLNRLEKRIVSVGLGAPLSGALSALGRDQELGARLAIDQLNDRGLILDGRIAKFQLIAEDDAGDPKQGRAVAQKLVESGVAVVVGHLTSGTSIPASKVYSDAGIPQITPAATNPSYTRQGYRTAFRIVADDAQLGGALGRYAVKELKGRSIAVIDDRTAYGQGLAEEFSKAVKAFGGSITSQQYITDKTTDFTAVLYRIKAKNPDIVFYGGMDAAAGSMLSQMKQLGIDAKVMGGDGMCSFDLPKLASGAMVDDQVVCAEAGGTGGTEGTGSRLFKQDYRAKFAADAGLYSPYAYDAVNVVAAAMAKAGSADPKVFLPDLAATEGYVGVTGNISFDEKGDLKNGALTLYTYKGQRREQIAVIR